MENKGLMVFSANQMSGFEGTNFDLIIQKGSKLTKMAMDRYHKGSKLAPMSFSIGSTENEYQQLNSLTYECILKYCAEKSGIENLDMNDKGAMLRAWANPQFSYWMFAIQTAIYQEVSSNNELSQALQMANVVGVGFGDSFTAEMDSLSLFQVQEGAYSNNVTRFQTQLRDAVTIVPKPKIAGVSFDVSQLNGVGYDFGKFMAKLVMSFRAKMYQDIVDVIYTVANVSSTVFYSAAFAKTTYITLAERLKGAAGAGVEAYGTWIALADASDNVTTGYTVQDELIKTSIISNLYGVPVNIVDQAVNSNSAAFTLRVPNDRFLLLANRGDKPVKLVKENGTMQVILKDGINAPLQERIYIYKDSWKAQYASQCPYAIQVI